MMSKLESRLHCPVCLGNPMGKLRLSNLSNVPSDVQGVLVLDHCVRCHGIWFDAEEMVALQSHPQPTELLSRRGILRSESRTMRCHSCHGLMDRNVSHCPDCGWQNCIDCPVCQKTMQSVQKNEQSIDQCSTCEGLWLDASEVSFFLQQSKIESITHQPHRNATQNSNLVENIVLEAAAPTIKGDVTRAGLEVGANAVVEVGGAAIREAPYLAEASVKVVGSTVQGLPAIAEASAEAIVTVVEVSGEAAGAIVGIIVQAIGGLL
jgi:Zn-finger nucleic acid-binding protein